MYDIKIFIENDGQFSARVNAGKEIVYGVGKTQKELIENITKGLELAIINKKGNSKVAGLFNYLYSDNSKEICH